MSEAFKPTGTNWETSRSVDKRNWTDEQWSQDYKRREAERQRREAASSERLATAAPLVTQYLTAHREQIVDLLTTAGTDENQLFHQFISDALSDTDSASQLSAKYQFARQFSTLQKTLRQWSWTPDNKDALAQVLADPQVWEELNTFDTPPSLSAETHAALAQAAASQVSIPAEKNQSSYTNMATNIESASPEKVNQTDKANENKDVSITEARTQNALEHEYSEPNPEVLKILQLTLTENNVDLYSQQAFANFINIIEAKKTEFVQLRPDTADLSGKELEDLMCAYYGMPDVSTTLDEINKLDHMSHRIDEVLAKSPLSKKILVRAGEKQEAKFPRASSGKEFEKAEITRRTKLLAMVLWQRFGVDPGEKEKFKCAQGLMDTEAMRDVPYFLVEINDIAPVPDTDDKGERIVLICNQKGNATFVFNSLILDELATVAQDLAALSKTELNRIITEYPQYSRRIIDRQDHFTGYLADAIAHPHTEKTTTARATEQPSNPDSLIIPAAPEGYLTRSAITAAAGVSTNILIRVLDSLGFKHQIFHFPTGDTFGYPSEALTKLQELTADDIRMRAEGRELQLQGWRSVHYLAREVVMAGPKTLQKIVTALQQKGKIGTGKMLEFGNDRPTLAFPPEDVQKIIAAYYEKYPAQERMPEGYMTVTRLSERLPIDYRALTVLLKQLESQGVLTPPTRYHTKGGNFFAYSPEQIQIIEREVVRLPRTQQSLAHLLGAEFGQIGRVILHLHNEGRLTRTSRYDAQAQRLIVDTFCTQQGQEYCQALNAKPQTKFYLENLPPAA